MTAIITPNYEIKQSHQMITANNDINECHQIITAMSISRLISNDKRKMLTSKTDIKMMTSILLNHDIKSRKRC
jgi:hypothetical protein